MGGRRSDYDGQFAMIEVGFWMTDPRILKLSATAKTFYLYTWIISIKERRETLPTWYNPRSISDASRIDPKSGRKAYSTLRENSLLGETADGRIIVYGVKSKHPNLKFKNDGISPSIGANTAPQEEEEIEIEEEGMQTAQTDAPPHDKWTEVFQTLRSIDAKNYANLVPDKDWIEMLDRAAAKIGGAAAVTSEVHRMKDWLLGKFESGAKKRNAKHSPRSQVSNWLNGAIKDLDQAGGKKSTMAETIMNSRG